VLTVGVDLAAEPANTAVARISWTAGYAEVERLVVGADNAVLGEEIATASKAGIDCPLGWPRRFVDFVVQHRDGVFAAPVDVAGKDWRRLLANRETDLVTRHVVGLVPLSVAADRAGGEAVRRAAGAVGGRGWFGGPQRGGRGGGGVSRGRIEALGAAVPRLQGRRERRGARRGGRPAGGRDTLAAVRCLRAGVPAVRPCAGRGRCRAQRPRRRGRPATSPTVEQTAAARTEGWIALPNGDLADLVP